jgi:hypothetical protein
LPDIFRAHISPAVPALLRYPQLIHVPTAYLGSRHTTSVPFPAHHIFINSLPPSYRPQKEPFPGPCWSSCSCPLLVLFGCIGWRAKWSSIWVSINYSTMQWKMFCNMVTITVDHGD